MQLGSQVMYSRTFLRNIGTFAGEICFVIGEIVDGPELVSPGHPARLVKVRWIGHSPSYSKDFGSEYLGTESLVLTSNLEPSIWKVG